MSDSAERVEDQRAGGTLLKCTLCALEYDSNTMPHCCDPEKRERMTAVIVLLHAITQEERLAVFEMFCDACGVAFERSQLRCPSCDVPQGVM